MRVVCGFFHTLYVFSQLIKFCVKCLQLVVRNHEHVYTPDVSILGGDNH
jgi:hypothetical protein